MSCDVFISYRRKDGSYPTMFLYHDLIESGYNVFYDVANIRNGEFPKLIEENIISCTDFLLVVTESTFSEKIFDENDWVHKEIKLALELNKNIVPVFVGGTVIPDNIPNDISKVCDYNGVNQIDPQMIHDINKKMFKEYLKAPYHSLDVSGKARQRCSIYDATYGDEFQRLRIQAQNSLSSDMDVLERYINKDKKYNVLDVGCAYGFVGTSRFRGESFSNIIGIDKNEKCILKAREITDDSRFSYYLADIESDEFDEKIESIMSENQIEKFDVIYVALVIHHLKEPIKFLKKAKKLLSQEGVIIVRGSDDGSKLAYNDNGLMKKIIDLTLAVSDVSDRYNGRKIFSQLKKAGFTEVNIFSYMRDISSLDFDERENLFNESFSYRINYVRREYESDPDSLQKRNNFLGMEELLAKFQERFYDTTFWYCEYDYIAVAKK